MASKQWGVGAVALVLNPDDFVIKRRRKQYKFAKFTNSPICFEFNEWTKKPIDVVEVGAGSGLFAVELAARHPELAFAAIDVKADRLQKGAYEATERKLTNIFFIRARADQLDELFGAGSLKQIWLTFPDPHPKKRSAGRRLTNPTFLRKYADLLAKDGGLFLKHDNRDFFSWSLEQLVVENWLVKELSFDLHESNLNDDYKLLTTYETRWLNEGLVTNFAKATRD
ncbi:MAG TPA: tRNA (guanosine(46)-N7)-methyltransferase TrmB [Candidatus Saccharimonadales bacterium]|nr:tRNA (guanosine(46)-N7)-methyltransferase TrmB [Candidatus Saccharimonadales bacterium]